MMIFKALSIAIRAHKGKKDKGGRPYILHPIYISFKVPSYRTKILALLHDVVEDSDISITDIKNAGISTDILCALELLSKKCDISYEDYIEKIRENELARTVKIQDLLHNSNINRIKKPSCKDYERVEKYKRALLALRES